MNRDQMLLLDSGLKKIVRRMESLRAIGIGTEQMKNYGVEITVGEASVLAQLAKIGMDVAIEQIKRQDAIQFAKEHFGVDI